MASSFPPGPCDTLNLMLSPATGSLGKWALFFVPINRSPSNDSDCAKPQLPRKLLTHPVNTEPTMFPAPWPPPTTGGAPRAGAPNVPRIGIAMGRGERERASLPWRMALPGTIAPLVVGKIVPEMPPEPSTCTWTASKPVCDLFVLLRCTMNTIASPCFRGSASWGLLFMPTKRSPGYFCEVTKPQVSWKLRTRPEHWRPTRSFNSAGVACTCVAWHFPLEPIEMLKVTGSPAVRVPKPGFEPECRNKSPSKSSDTTKPQPSRKLRTMPRARWPTKASGLPFGSPVRDRMVLGIVTGTINGEGMGCWKASLSTFTFTAWMPLFDFSSRAIWNSTHLPCCKPFMPSCGLALTPTKTSPSKREELRRPQLSLKLLTQPRTVWPTRLCTSSFSKTAFVAWYSPDDEVGSSATSNCTGSPGPTGPSSGLDLAWMKRSPTNISEFAKPHWSRKLFILPVTDWPTRCGTCARSAGPVFLGAAGADIGPAGIGMAGEPSS
mmetsp:Transcript_85765/g.227947  ORF Transcript_85765/g.227947 Transcript_85765/m.227947 type:complete len:493 (-) Transcript_85765:565-2043(-)